MPQSLVGNLRCRTIIAGQAANSEATTPPRWSNSVACQGVMEKHDDWRYDEW